MKDLEREMTSLKRKTSLFSSEIRYRCMADKRTGKEASAQRFTSKIRHAATLWDVCLCMFFTSFDL